MTKYPKALITAALLATALLLGGPSAPAACAASTSYYVSSAGNDVTGNGSASNPWKTIQKAANTIPSGATVHIAAGTYNERVNIPATKSGSAGATSKFIADGKVVVSQGFVVNSSYTDLSGFEVTPGTTSGMGEYAGQIDVAGDNNTFTGFNVHHIKYGAGFGVRVGASYNTIQNFKIDDVQWSGITTTNTYNSGSDHTTIRNGTIAHHRGRAGIDLSGNYHMVDGVTIVGGPSGTAEGSLDGDGIRVNYNTGSVIRNTTIHDLWEWYNDPQHTDCIQMWVSVKDLVIENCTLGTWEPGPAPSQRGGIAQEIGPSQLIMVGTVSTNSSVSFTARNNLFLGQTGTNASIVTAKNSGATINIKLLNNTFWSSYPSLNSVDTAVVRNNIFREFYIYPANKSGIDSDYNIFCWLPSQGDNTLSTSEGSHSIGKTYATRVNPSSLFINPDVSAATDFGGTADFRLKAGAPAIGAGQGTYAPATDKNGATRTSPVDIGAYEYGSPAAPAPGAYTPSPSAPPVPDTTAPRPVSSLTAAPTNSVSLRWVNPTSSDFLAVRVMRSTTGFATSPLTSAGQYLVYEGVGSSFVDNPSASVVTYYTVFARDRSGNWSVPAKVAQSPVTRMNGSVVFTSAYNKPGVVRMRLVDPNGVGIRGKKVLLRRADGYVVTMAPVTKSGTPAGTYSALAYALGKKKTTFTVQYQGDGFLKPSWSTVTVVPRAYIYNPALPSGLKAKSTFNIYARLLPKHAAGSKSGEFRFYRYEKGKWVRRKTVTAKIVDYKGTSRMTARTTMPYSGKWRVRGYHNDADHAVTYSTYDYRTVK